jgi:hypothetical protein
MKKISHIGEHLKTSCIPINRLHIRQVKSLLKINSTVDSDVQCTYNDFVLYHKYTRVKKARRLNFKVFLRSAFRNIMKETIDHGNNGYVVFQWNNQRG